MPTLYLIIPLQAKQVGEFIKKQVYKIFTHPYREWKSHYSVTLWTINVLISLPPCICLCQIFLCPFGQKVCPKILNFDFVLKKLLKKNQNWSNLGGLASTIICPKWPAYGGAYTGVGNFFHKTDPLSIRIFLQGIVKNFKLVHSGPIGSTPYLSKRPTT